MMIKRIYTDWLCSECGYVATIDPVWECPKCGKLDPSVVIKDENGGYFGKKDKEYQDYLKSKLDPRD